MHSNNAHKQLTLHISNWIIWIFMNNTDRI